MSIEANKETVGFQAEVKQLLHLMINALYSNKEIFLRELISNASDASEKLRFEALSNDSLYEGDSTLKVQLEVDKDKRTVTIRDSGIGMTRDEVVQNIGTIARSGTREFFGSLTGDQAKDSQLIGQFGVGFYSSFIVADKVTLRTRKAGTPAAEGVFWESAGDGEYVIETIERSPRGTEIVLHLREGEDEFLEEYQLRSIVKKYSDHITFPVTMEKVTTDEEKNETTVEEETINNTTALWSRSKSEINDDEYNEFYKHISHDFEDPMLTIHNRVEGTLEYTSLLYVPKRAPFDMWDRQNRHGVKLYVRRVFIMDDAEHLLPPYLRFVRGVIDSNDLPLNISREILQNNKQIDSIRNGVVKKVLGTLESTAKNEPEDYATFWKEFGKVMKEGVIDDTANRERVAKLLRFASTHNDTSEPEVSLEDYVSRMQDGQDKIYYITADSFAAAKGSPHLEIFRKKGIEVLLLHEQVDEWVAMHLTEFDDKPLQSVTKGSLDLGDLEDEAEKEEQAKVEEELKPFVERVKEALGEVVQDVRITHRLTDSPACLVADEHAMDASLERILKAAGQAMPDSKPIMELNPDHILIKTLKAEENSARFQDWVWVLHDQALLSEGAQLEDPARFVNRVNQILVEAAMR